MGRLLEMGKRQVMTDCNDDLDAFNELPEGTEYIEFHSDGLGIDNAFVPKCRLDIPLTRDEAKIYMKGWSFNTDCCFHQPYSVTIWTKDKIFYVNEYDGSTWLESLERNPDLSKREKLV